MGRNTAEYLAAALRAAGAPDEMVAKATDGYYDDYRSPLAFPITQLVHDAVFFGLSEVAERARRGDFDGTSEEAAAWARSPDGQETFRQLIEGR
jgi:hypothetical protein